MSGALLAWAVAAVAVAVAGFSFLAQRRQAGEAAAARAALARADAERAQMEAEGRATAKRLHAVEAELAELRAAQAALADALDRLPIPLWRRRADLSLADCNAAYANAAEADRATVLGEGRALGGQAVSERAQALAGLARTARIAPTESFHVVIGGQRRLLEFTEAPLPDGGTIGLAIDVTGREEAEAELARHVAAHGKVLESLPTSIVIYGPDRRLKFFNSAFVKLSRLDESWLRTEPEIGEILETLRERRDLPEHSDFPAFKRRWRHFFTSLVEPLEQLDYLPDGRTHRVRAVPHPLGGLFVTREDVSDNLALERSYNTLVAVQRETLDHLYEGVAVIGGDGRLKLSNPAYGRIWQLPQEALAAEPHIADIIERNKDFYDDGDDWPGLKERIIARLTDRSPRSGRLGRSDGSVLDYAIVPLPDGAVLLSYVDVTDSFRVERALRERAEALEAADRLKTEFIATVSYELRTPLNVIIGFAEILSRAYFGPLNARQLEYCRGITVSSQQLLAIINDILDLASIEASRMSLERAPVELRPLLDGVATVMQDMARAGSLRLAVDCPVDGRAVEIDERRVKQALCNLVSNAVKFTPAGGSITLSGRVESGRAMVSVSDTGVGIPAEDHKRVFETFVRGGAGGKKGRGAGPGLGLSLVKRIVELHGGHVEIDSAPNRGTTVTCVLPVNAPPGALAGG
ncbi:MAG: ATP-binding protein [Pseudomonadota bacterium]